MKTIDELIVWLAFALMFSFVSFNIYLSWSTLDKVSVLEKIEIQRERSREREYLERLERLEHLLKKKDTDIDLTLIK